MNNVSRKITRHISSLYYEVRARLSRFKEETHCIESVPHYSERCGWKEFGAHDNAEYEYWWQEACGIVSLRIILDALDPSGATTQKPIFAQIQDAIKQGAYFQKTENSTTVRIGWIHGKLIELGNERNVQGRSLKLSTEGICYALKSGKLVMASVYRPFSRFIDEDVPRKKAGGHLVVIRGYEWKDGRCTGLFVADPYDKTARNKAVDTALFADIYSGSAIVFYK